MKNRTTPLIALASAAILLLAGCAASEPTADSTAPAAESITIADAWVKSAESGMSAAFGELINNSDQDITVTASSTSAADMVELHETVENDTGEMVMRPKEGGFIIPAGGSFALEPGGNHIMLMGLAGPVVAGAELDFTLTFSDGSTLEFTAPVKDYSGANENYEGGDMDMDMDMDN